MRILTPHLALTYPNHCLVSEPDPRKNRKEGLGAGDRHRTTATDKATKAGWGLEVKLGFGAVMACSPRAAMCGVGQ